MAKDGLMMLILKALVGLVTIWGRYRLLKIQPG